MDHRSVVAIEKEAFGSPSTKVANFTYYFKQYSLASVQFPFSLSKM